MRPNKESVLLKTSAATDVQCSGGEIAITGLKPVSKKNILDISQIKYKAEVAQVIRVGTSSYTPTLDTVYAVKIGDVNRTQSGFEETLKIYSFRTPTTWGASYTTDALRREYIHGELITRINADASNKGVAASLTGGAGFSFTDDASYYPVFSQGMSNTKFVSTVLPVTNADGSGFADTDYSVYVTGVMKSGVGAYLAAMAPVLDYANGGNLVSGVIDTPPQAVDKTYATSGQNYDCFSINAYATQAAWGGQNQVGFVSAWKEIWVDNGTGSATTNLSGFKAFERVMHKLMVGVYATDASCVQEWFDRPIVFQDPLGAAPTGTADTLGWQYGYTPLNRTNIGTQTIVAPVLDATGLLLDQDDTAGEGSHTSAYQGTLGDQSFIVGKTAFMVGARVVAGDWTDTQFMVGVRKKEAYAADYNNYNDLAAIGGAAADGDSITTQGILNGAATVATDTTVNFADAVSIMLWVKVDINGAVTCWANGTSYPVYSAGTTALVLDAGDEFIPFYQHVNIGSGNPAVSIGEFFAVATDTLIN
jgi:hypothetical protein